MEIEGIPLGGGPKIFPGGVGFSSPGGGGVPKHQLGGGMGGGQRQKKIFDRLRRPKMPHFAAFGGKIWLGGGAVGHKFSAWGGDGFPAGIPPCPPPWACMVVIVLACELDRSPPPATSLCRPQMQVASEECVHGEKRANVTGSPKKL